MNRPLIQKIIDVLEGRLVTNEKLGFNMDSFVDGYEAMEGGNGPCGTSACIAGWAVALGSEKVKVVRDLVVLNSAEPIEEEAVDLLSMPFHDAHRLFYPDTGVLWGDITRKQAANVLKHLLKTGAVDWSVA